MTIAISVGPDYNNARVERRAFADFEELTAFVLAQQENGGKVGPYICAPMRNDHRLSANAELACVMALDFDDLQPGAPRTICEAITHAGWRAVTWTTRSSTPEAPRLRVLLELDRGLDKTDYGACYRGIVRHLADVTGIVSLEADSACEKPEQPAVLPQPASTLWTRAEGSTIDTDAFIQFDPGTRPEPSINGHANGAAVANGDRIPDGQRHKVLTSLAGTMRRRGMTGEAIYAALEAENAARCDPPLPDTDLRSIAANYAKYDAPADRERAEDPLAKIRAALVADLEAGPAAIDDARPPTWVSYPRLPVAGACLAAPGATGKTTLVLGEMVHIAAGLPLYGEPVDMPGPCVYVSAEDGATYPRYLLQRILADGQAAGALSEHSATVAKNAVRIIGWSRTKYGPIMAADDAGNTHVCAVWPLLLELLAPLKPVYVTLDPSVLFGPGERLGNDAAAAFAALMHETAQAIGACVQTIDHVAQSVARGGIVDQYASRGGTGKVDESRLARQLVRVTQDATEPMPALVSAADVAEGRVFALHWTKPSYAPRPAPAWLRRRGYWFEHLRAPSANESAQDEQAGIVDAMREVLASGDYVPAASTGQRTALHVLSAARAFPNTLKNTAGKRRFWRHVEELRRIRTLREGSIRRENRHVVATLELQATPDEGASNAPNA